MRRGTRYALRAALGQPRRVSSRSMRVLRHACHPANTPPQAQPDGSLFRAFASLGHQGRARSATSGMGRAQRRPETTPSVCAWGAQGAGWRVCRRTHPLRQLTRRGCLNGAPQARSEFHGAPRARAPQVAPQRSEGTQRVGSPFFWVRFFGEAKKSTSPAGARPGLRPQQGSAPRPAQGFEKPERLENSQTIKTIAASAFYTSASRQNH